MRKDIDLVFITLSSPIMIGVYENNKLVESMQSDKKSSDILPTLYKELDKKYNIKKLFYANGPGSFMAIKIAYIFLKSISVLKNIPLYATDAFYFNKNAPIKAIGKLYFVKVSSKIETKKVDDILVSTFQLPDRLDYDEFSEISTPLYSIGAVG